MFKERSFGREPNRRLPPLGRDGFGALACPERYALFYTAQACVRKQMTKIALHTYEHFKTLWRVDAYATVCIFSYSRNFRSTVVPSRGGSKTRQGGLGTRVRRDTTTTAVPQVGSNAPQTLFYPESLEGKDDSSEGCGQTRCIGTEGVGLG